LLPEPAVNACMKCHNQSIKKADGTIVLASMDLIDPKLLKHGPLKEGNCGGCHDVHGGSRADLLSKNYSRLLYQKFTPGPFEFCFSCHDVRGISDKETTTLTNFRNGS